MADTSKAILNGNPAVDLGHTHENDVASALALPLTHAGQVIGVVALYRRERDAFAADELVALLELCPAVASLLLEAADAEPLHSTWPEPDGSGDTSHAPLVAIR